MSIVTLPTNLRIGAGGGMGQARFDLLSQSDSSGSQQVRMLAPPRWTLRLVQPDNLTQTDGAAWQALALQLRGRVNVLAAWDTSKPAPLGTARGAMVTSGTLAIGATSVAIAGAVCGPNLTRGGSFEIDTDADGLADGWDLFSAGTTGAVSFANFASADVHGARVQRVAASGLGVTFGDVAGITRTVALGGLVGQTLTLSVYGLKSSGGPSYGLQVYLNWIDAGGNPVGSYSQSTSTPGGAWVRYSVTAAAPAGAASARIYVLMRQADTEGGVSMDLDAVQLEFGAAATPYAGLATLKAGDWLQIGTGLGSSHYCMVAADAVANDAGVLTVAIEPPTRQAFSTSTAVAWDKPLAYYRQQTDASTWTLANGGRSGPLLTGMSFDLMETWS